MKIKALIKELTEVMESDGDIEVIVMAPLLEPEGLPYPFNIKQLQVVGGGGPSTAFFVCEKHSQQKEVIAECLRKTIPR